MVQVRESVRELLAGKVPSDKVDELARLLSEGTGTHEMIRDSLEDLC